MTETVLIHQLTFENINIEIILLNIFSILTVKSWLPPQSPVTFGEDKLNCVESVKDLWETKTQLFQAFRKVVGRYQRHNY